MKLSLIIPVYNVEKYIEACLKSILIQLPCEGVEIIIVNDGSQDHSMMIVEKILNGQDENIAKSFRIFNQENQGVSAARNYGIKLSEGEYIAFLDSDDFLDDCYFTKVLNVIEEFGPDIIKLDAQRIDEQGQISRFLKPIGLDGLYDFSHEICIEESNQCAWFPWLRVYKSTFFNENLFPVGMKYVEDAYTIPYVLLEAKNIYYLNNALVFYRINSQSATAIETVSNVDDLKRTIYKMLNQLMKESCLSASVISLSQSYIAGSLNTEGVLKAHQRWSNLRKDILKNPYFDNRYIRNRGNKLFFNFGIMFLLFCKLLKK
ncbi:glycosyltransferase [Acinetobacter gyllenbergii]|nr:glycosyltransferase [Acinetobacter gyllenbergii]